MTLFRGDVEIVPPYSGDVDTWARDVGDWAYRYLQSHTEWLRVIQDIAPITTGLYWERNSSTATLTPVVANDNSDIGTGLLTCGNIAASGAITWSGGSSALTNAHIVSTGESHTYIDQSLTTTDSPQFTSATLGYLFLWDTDKSHRTALQIADNHTRNNPLSFNMGNATRTITLSGNPTLADWFDQSVKVAAKPEFAGLTFSAAMLPTVDNTINIGSGAKRIANLYVGGDAYVSRDLVLNGGEDADIIIKSGATEWFNLDTAAGGNISLISLGTMSFSAAGGTKTTTVTALANHLASTGDLHTALGTVTSGTLSTGLVIAGVTMTLGSDAGLDMYYRSAAGVLTRLAKGAANEVLSMNADASAFDWVAQSEGHTQGTDTTLGIMTADINMGTSYQLTNLAAPAGSGEAIRQTATITETNLTTLTNASNADALHSHTGSTASDIVVIDTDDTSCYIAMFDDATGTMAIKTDANLTYNATTDALSCASLVLTGSITMASELGDVIQWTGGWQNIGINSEYLVFRSYEAATSLGFKFEGTETPANEYLRIHPNALDSASFNRWNIYSKENIALIAETDVVTLGGVGTDEVNLTFSANTVTLDGVTDYVFSGGTLKATNLKGASDTSVAIETLLAHAASTGASHSYINQNVTTTGTPSFTSVNATTLTGNALEVDYITVNGRTISCITVGANTYDLYIEPVENYHICLGDTVGTGNVTPRATDITGLGTAALKWKDLHVLGAVNCATVVASGDIYAGKSIYGARYIILSAADDLATAYAYLISGDRDATWGAASAINRRALILGPGAHPVASMLVLSADFCDIIAMEPCSGGMKQGSDLEWTGAIDSATISMSGYRPPPTIIYGSFSGSWDTDVPTSVKANAVVKQTADNVRLCGFGIVNIENPGTIIIYPNIEDDHWATAFCQDASDNTVSVYDTMYFYTYGAGIWNSSGGTGTNAWKRHSTYSVQTEKGYWKDCIANGWGYRTAGAASLSANMVNCVGGSFSWCGDESGAIIENATFRNCHGVGHFNDAYEAAAADGSPSIASGYACFCGCRSYGGTIENTAYFYNCTAGDKSFGLGFNSPGATYCAGNFYDCHAGRSSFGGWYSGAAYYGEFRGYAINCTAQKRSFASGSTSCTMTGTCINCTIGEAGDTTTQTWYLQDAANVIGCTIYGGTSQAPLGLTSTTNTTAAPKIYNCTIIGVNGSSQSIYAASAQYAYISNNICEGLVDTDITNRVDGSVKGVLKIGDTGVTNYAQFAADGELTLSGTARVTKREMLIYFNKSAEAGSENNYYGSDYDASTDEYTTYYGQVPVDCDDSLPINLKFRWCPTVNNGGSETSVMWWVRYNHAIGSGLLAAYHNIDPWETVVPASEPAQTLHETSVELTELSAGDFVFIWLFRDADHATDDYAADAFVPYSPVLEYTSNKLGTAT